MSKRKEDWNTKENAEAYDKYAEKFSMYKDTSRDLVEISGIKAGMIVVDLAAGTGTTTQAIIEKTNGNVSIMAVEQAEEMLKKAREKFANNKNIKFLVAQAEELDKVIEKSVNVVICNSAFWQIKPRKVIGAVSNVLKDGGVFAFNLPDQYFNYGGFSRQSRNPLSYNLLDLIVWGKEVGLVLIDQIVKEYESNLDEIIAFNEIPVMKKNFNNEEDKEKFINELKRKLDKDSYKKSQWVYFIFRKQKRGLTEV